MRRAGGPLLVVLLAGAAWVLWAGGRWLWAVLALIMAAAILAANLAREARS